MNLLDFRSPHHHPFAFEPDDGPEELAALHEYHYRHPWYSNGLAMATDGRAIAAHAIALKSEAKARYAPKGTMLRLLDPDHNTGSAEAVARNLMSVDAQRFHTPAAIDAVFLETGEVGVRVNGTTCISPKHFYSALRHVGATVCRYGNWLYVDGGDGVRVAIAARNVDDEDCVATWVPGGSV